MQRLAAGSLKIWTCCTVRGWEDHLTGWLFGLRVGLWFTSGASLVAGGLQDFVFCLWSRKLGVEGVKMSEDALRHLRQSLTLQIMRFYGLRLFEVESCHLGLMWVHGANAKVV